MAIIISHSHCSDVAYVSILVVQNFDRMIFGRFNKVAHVGSTRTTNHKCRSKQILKVRRIFVRISPNLPEKLLCDFCLQKISHKDHEDLFLVWPPKRGLFSGILPKFSRILPGFSTNQNFWGCACIPYTLASYTSATNVTRSETVWEPLQRMLW